MHTVSEEHDQHASREAAGAERGQLLADIANAVVRIHKRFYGKGPTKARAQLSHDLLTVLLHGGYTRGEQTLQDHGFGNEVVQARLAMQRAVEGEFRAAIESLLLRPVRSMMSANDPANGLQVEVFVLGPAEGPAGDGSAPSVQVAPGIIREAQADGAASLGRSDGAAWLARSDGSASLARSDGSAFSSVPPAGAQLDGDAS